MVETILLIYVIIYAISLWVSAELMDDNGIDTTFVSVVAILCPIVNTILAIKLIPRGSIGYFFSNLKDQFKDFINDINRVNKLNKE